MQKCNFFKLLSCFRMQKFQGRIVCRRMTSVHLFIVEAQFTAAPSHLFSHHTTIAANCASSLYGESFSRTQLWHSFWCCLTYLYLHSTCGLQSLWVRGSGTLGRLGVASMMTESSPSLTS